MGDLLTSRAQALQVTTSSFFFFTKKNLLLFFLYSLMCVSSPRVTRPSLKLLSETMIRRLQIMQNGFLLSSKSYILTGLLIFGPLAFWFYKTHLPLGFLRTCFLPRKTTSVRSSFSSCSISDQSRRRIFSFSLRFVRVYEKPNFGRRCSRSRGLKRSSPRSPACAFLSISLCNSHFKICVFISRYS